MGLMDILQQYSSRPTSTEQDFEEVAPQVPADVLGQGVAHAFRSDATPPFGNMVSQLFGNSNASLRSGVLGQLIRVAGPAVLAKIAGGALSHLGRGAQAGGSGASAPTISETEAAQVTPDQVREIAEEAQKKDPSIMDRVGEMYGQHPQVLKALGGAALAIALGQIAGRMNR